MNEAASTLLALLTALAGSAWIIASSVLSRSFLGLPLLLAVEFRYAIYCEGASTPILR